VRLFKATYRDRRGRARGSAKWYAEFRGHLGVLRRLPLYVDRAASVQAAGQLRALVGCRAAKMQPGPELSAWLELNPEPAGGAGADGRP
jgi:hypothetical protein